MAAKKKAIQCVRFLILSFSLEMNRELFACHDYHITF